MKTKNFIPSILILLFFSCSQITTDYNYNKPIPSTIKCEPNDIITLKLLDTLLTDLYNNEFDSIKFTKLEITNKCIIGEHSNVHIHDNKIIIADRKTNSIYVYGMEGNFLYSINKTGQGPEEYTALSSVILSDSNIYITDFISSKFLQYGLNGRCIKERINTKYTGTYIFPFSDTLYAEANCYLESPYELTFTDKYQNMLGCAKPHKTNLPFSAGSFVPKSNNEIYYCGKLNDTIFLVNEKSIKPYLCLGLYTKETLSDFYTKAFATKNQNEFMKYVNLKTPIPTSYSFLESDLYWTFQFYDYKYTYISIVEKKTKKTRTYIQRDNKTGELYNIIGPRGIYNNDWIMASLSVQTKNVWIS